MAAGWTNPKTQEEPAPPPPKRSRWLPERMRAPLRSLRSTVARSLAAGRDLVSAGIRAAGGAWNQLVGRQRAAVKTTPAPRADVVELREYRAAQRKSAGAGLQEERVEQSRTEVASSRPVEAPVAKIPEPPQVEMAEQPSEIEAAASAAEEAPSVDQTIEAREAPVTAQADESLPPQLEPDPVADASEATAEGQEASEATAEGQEAAADTTSAEIDPPDAEPSAAAAEAASPEVVGESSEIEARESDRDDSGEDDGDEEESAGDDASAKAETEGDEDESQSVEGDRLDAILESLLLASGAPLTVRRMCDAIRSGPKAKEVRAALKRLKQRYGGDCGIHLDEVAGGYQFRTAPANAKYVRNLLREKPGRLGRAALETLSIIAYKQPVTRGEIEAIRGVDADSAVNTLLSKRLIKIDGRKETVGRPLLYSTTPEFLEVFGLKDLKELPTLKEIGPVPEPENEEDDEEASLQDGDAEEAILEAAAGGQAEQGSQAEAAAEDVDGAAAEASGGGDVEVGGDEQAVAATADTGAVEDLGDDEPGEGQGFDDAQEASLEQDQSEEADDSASASAAAEDDPDPEEGQR